MLPVNGMFHFRSMLHFFFLYPFCTLWKSVTRSTGGKMRKGRKKGKGIEWWWWSLLDYSRIGIFIPKHLLQFCFFSIITPTVCTHTFLPQSLVTELSHRERERESGSQRRKWNVWKSRKWHQYLGSGRKGERIWVQIRIGRTNIGKKGW